MTPVTLKANTANIAQGPKARNWLLPEHWGCVILGIDKLSGNMRGNISDACRKSSVWHSD